MPKQLPDNFDDLQPDQKLRERANIEKRGILGNAAHNMLAATDIPLLIMGVAGMAGLAYGAITAPFRNAGINRAVERAIDKGNVTDDGYIALEAGKEASMHDDPARVLKR